MKIPIELKKKYLERRIEEIQNLLKSLESDDFSLALRLGHQIKGNAQTFEFPQMAPLGTQIELAAKKRDRESVALFSQIMVQVIQAAQNQFH